jgi:dienelactone hydrolase
VNCQQKNGLTLIFFVNVGHLTQNARIDTIACVDRMRFIVLLILALITVLPPLERSAQSQVSGENPQAHIRTNDQGNDFKPPPGREAWLVRRQQVRERILVATGLYPMPEKTPLNPRVYGKIERDGYTIEKVVLETLPGFYLSGNLYRPVGKSGRLPGILNPHGHWKEGRFTADVQARGAGQARMGAVAFLYDMVGYGDSKPFGHAFMDDELAALGMSLTGLQLWNSLRALDWLLSLPDVDPKRIACTGESGGGTQTFLLCAVEDRIQVAAPVCMVSHHYQGGCTCENSPLLRVGTDNVEIAACFAPKPQILVGATGDWTSQIMQRGVPEIRAVYKLFGAEDKFFAVVHDAKHNYNQTSRESVYTFFKQHLWGETVAQPIKEAAFQPEDAATLSTWDAEHPRPANAVNATELKKYLRGMVERQVATWQPTSLAQWKQARGIIRTGLANLLDCSLPQAADLDVEHISTVDVALFEYHSEKLTLARKGVGDRSTVLWLAPANHPKPSTATVIVHPLGINGLLVKEGSTDKVVAGLLHQGQAILIVEAFLTDTPDAVAGRQSSKFYTTYNRTVLAQRVQDILNAVAYARGQAKRVNLVGLEHAGPWVLLARPFAGDIQRTAADAAQWEWTTTQPVTNEMALPAALRYGGMKAFIALAAPNPLFLHHYGATDISWLQNAYRLEGGKALRTSPTQAAPEALVAWITKKN